MDRVNSLGDCQTLRLAASLQCRGCRGCDAVPGCQAGWVIQSPDLL